MNDIPCIQRRIDLPLGRQFTENQKYLIVDYKENNYCLDPTSAYGLRPPELTCVSLKVYVTCFVRVLRPTTKKEMIPDAADISKVPLEDGSGKYVKIRFFHIEQIVEYFIQILQEKEISDTWLSLEQKMTAQSFLTDVLIPIRNKMEKLDDPYEQLRSMEIVKNFVDFKSCKRCIPVYPPVSPQNAMLFSYHLIMLYGRFTTELDIIQQGSLKQAMLSTGVVKEETQEACNQIAGIYVSEILSYDPNSSKAFNRLLKRVVVVIQDVVLRDGLDYGTLPAIMLKQIEKQYSDESKNRMQELHALQVAALAQVGIPNFPPENDLITRRPVQWDPINALFDPQFELTEWEGDQRKVLFYGMKKINELVFPTENTFLRSMLIVGSPGVGKTWISAIIVTYALSKSLRVISTALTSLRARQLGGLWIHALFAMSPENASSNDPNMMANKCTMTLQRNPVRLAMLQALDVLAIDEIGLISLTHLLVIDIVLRTVRNCKRPFGGVLIIATGDHAQLPSVEGELVWNSLTLLTCFDWFRLRHLVRSSDDKDLQEIINATRKYIIPDDEIEKLKTIISEKATHVKSFNDAPESFIKVVSTRRAQKQIQQDSVMYRLEKLENTNHERRSLNLPQLKRATFNARDQIVSSTGTWEMAPQNISKQLDTSVREHKSVLVCEGDLMRVTKNDLSRPCKYSHGQTCRVIKIEFDEGGSPEAVHVEMANLGTNDFPDKVTKVRFTQVSTTSVTVTRSLVVARRVQIPLVNNESFTIHKCQGQEPVGVVTQMSDSDKSPFRIWDREQLITVMSRVRLLKNVYFVGSKEETLRAVEKVLRKRPYQWQTIEKMIEVSDLLRYQSIIPVDSNLPLQSPYKSLPEGEIPCVYIFVSSEDHSILYIGHTKNLRAELLNANGIAPVPSDEKIEDNVIPNMHRPWICLGYVLGRENHLTLDERYIIRTNLRGAASQRDSYQACVEIRNLIERRNDENLRQIILMLCCSMNILRHSN